MSFVLIIGCIILGIIIIAALFIGIVIFAMYSMMYSMYCVASGIAYKNETEVSAWDYWETHKLKPWAELSVEEKKMMIDANMIIANDVGSSVTEAQIQKMLEEQLPIIEPNVGLSYNIEHE